MENEVNKLIDTVLNWWKEHEYDCCSNGEEEFNVYDDEPEFVTLAKKIKEY